MWTNYEELFTSSVTYTIYFATFKFAFLTWVFTLLIGFTVAYFLAFHVHDLKWQIVLFLLCTIPFWTSNIIRMIAWIPVLGRHGLVNEGLLSARGGRRAGSSGCCSRSSPWCSRSCTSTRCSW